MLAAEPIPHRQRWSGRLFSAGTVSPIAFPTARVEIRRYARCRAPWRSCLVEGEECTCEASSPVVPGREPAGRERSIQPTASQTAFEDQDDGRTIPVRDPHHELRV